VVVKAAAIIAGLLAVDVAAVVWTRSGLPSARAAWQRIQRYWTDDSRFYPDG
jgi:hypothetical protein